MMLANDLPENETMRVKIVGPDFDDPDVQNHTNIILALGEKTDAETRFMNAGLMILEEEDKVVVDGLTWDSSHKQIDKLFSVGDPDNPLQIAEVYLKRDRMPKEIFFIPALLLLGLIMLMQKSRIRKYGHPVPVSDDA